MTVQNLTFRAVTFTIRKLARLLCRVDDTQVDRLPMQGPLILLVNHINFLDVPLVFTHVQPRQITALVKQETWDNPAMGFLFTLWKGIPIRRGEADRKAFRMAQEALKNGHLLAVAPEGTRSGNGVLQPGRAGVALLAMQSNVPLQPVVYYGNEKFWQNLRRLRRTDFKIVVGNPFRVDTRGEKPSKELAQAILTEMMFQMAALLPESYRGPYADLSRATEHYLVFDPGVQSNLAVARATETETLKSEV